MDIIKIIRENRLMYTKLELLTKKLSEITKLDINLIKNKINQLIHSGELFLDDKNKVSISKDRGFLKAKLILNKKGFGFAQVENMPDIFIPAFQINGAFDKDDCLVEITNRKTDEDIEGRIVKILNRNTTHVVGTYIEGKSKNVVFPDDIKLPQIRIFKPDSMDAKNNDKVYVEVFFETIGENIMHGRIVEILGKANTPKAEQLSIIRSYNLDEKFPEDVLKIAKSINQEVKLENFKKRKNYTEQKVITIDGEDARDFDDAISIEKDSKGGYTLYVHIADVSNYVVENSKLDKEAYARGTSVYFPNMVIPMLPKEISNGICSLSEGVNRLTLTVEMKLDKNFDVISHKVYEGVIKSSHRMTYTEVQKILENDSFLIEKYADVYEDILMYQKISNRLKEQKKLRGEIRLNIPEPFILENDKGEIVSIENRVQDEAHEIIEDLMVLTNECIAKQFFDLKLSFIYRVHEKPDAEKIARLSQILKNMGVANQLESEEIEPKLFQAIIEKIQGSPKEKTLSILVLRSMMKAKYLPTCLGHFGLASEYYCHFTSPIRRYPDLMIHRIIKSYINGVQISEIKLKYDEIVYKASEQSSVTEKNAEEAEREMDDYKKAVYMSKFLGEEFEATISGVQEFGVFVELENGIEGLVKLENLPMDDYVYDDLGMSLNGKYNHFTIGDKHKVLVSNVNINLHQIDFELVGVENVLGSKKILKTTKTNNSKRKNSRTSQKQKSKIRSNTRQKGKSKRR